MTLNFQLEKEKLYDRAIEMMGEGNYIIVYDRGLIDNSAYVKQKEFEIVLSRVNGAKNFIELINMT